MPQIDSLQSAFYFHPATAAAGEQSRKTEKSATKKSRFANLVEQHAAEAEVASVGLPLEIAGMDFEEAFVYLKDKADMASDALKNDFGLETFAAYRTAVGHLMKFIVHSNYDVKLYKRRRPNRRFKTEKFYLVHIIDEKLDKLAADILSNHFETLQMLSRIDEINGILIDLIT